MKITNFKLLQVIGNSEENWKFKASVDVTTRNWFISTTETKEVFKKYGRCWYFVESGEFIPYGPVDQLVRSFEAQKGKELQFCLNS